MCMILGIYSGYIELSSEFHYVENRVDLKDNTVLVIECSQT